MMKQDKLTPCKAINSFRVYIWLKHTLALQFVHFQSLEHNFLFNLLGKTRFPAEKFYDIDYCS